VRARIGLVLLAVLAVAMLVWWGGSVGSVGAQVCPTPGLPTCPTTTTTAESPTTTTTAAPTTTTTVVESPPAAEAIFVPDTIPPFTPVEPAPVTETTVAAARPARAPVRAVEPFGGVTAAAVTGTYGIGVGTVLLAGLVVIAFSSRIRRPPAAASGGDRVNDSQRRWRLFAALGCIALAAVVGLVGYLKLSLEPAVNRQIPYLASAGMALVLLAAIGGSLLVAEQIRADDDRIGQLEDSVRRLAEALGPQIEAPARKKT
jgi:hypothetical protein